MSSELSINALDSLPLRFNNQSIRGLLIALALEADYAWAGHFLGSLRIGCRDVEIPPVPILISGRDAQVLLVGTFQIM
jgi:hypothetical protein